MTIGRLENLLVSIFLQTAKKSLTQVPYQLFLILLNEVLIFEYKRVWRRFKGEESKGAASQRRAKFSLGAGDSINR